LKSQIPQNKKSHHIRRFNLAVLKTSDLNFINDSAKDSETTSADNSRDSADLTDASDDVAPSQN
jgi:hypothetical protein